MTNSGVEAFMDVGAAGEFQNIVASNFVDQLKDRIDKVKDTDVAVKELAKKEKRKKREVKVDSDLSGFIE